jgi:hypothetical protein
MGYLCAVKNTFLLLGLLILFRPIFPVLDYVANYDYIAKILCENKEKPELKCNGKCHLMKEMAKASENEKPLSQDKKSSIQESEILFVQQFPFFEIKFIPTSSLKEINLYYTNLYCYNKIESVFHPPTV